MITIFFLLVISIALTIAYKLGWVKGEDDGFMQGYHKGRLEMAVKLNEIKNCDRMIEKILRENIWTRHNVDE